MLKKMVKKRDLSKSNVIKKNMFYTPISTRYTSLVSEHSLKTENTKSTKCLGYSKRIGNSITESGQSLLKMKNNVTTFESTKDLTSLRDESSIIGKRKKSVNSVKSTSNNVSITLSQSSIRRKSSKQVIRLTNQVKMNEDDSYKLTNYTMIKTLIQREFVILRQKTMSSTKNIHHPVQRKDTIIHMNTISNRNSIPYTSKKIILSRSTDKQKNVNEITNTLYSQIFEGIFKAIAIYPNVLDRNYITLNKLQYMNVCFLKPFFEVLFKSNLTIQKDTFIQMCNIIYSNLTYEEKKQFIFSNRIFFKNYI